MQSTTIRQRLVQFSALLVFSFIALSFTRVGLDSYEIYLNRQLVLKQAVNEPLNLRKLPLDKAKDNDLLHIRYRHCQSPYVGTDRTILVRDEKGNALKKWSFNNATQENSVMVIPVKELLRLKRAHPKNELSMLYTSKELSRGETLAFVSF